MKTDSTILNIVLDVTINMSAFVSAFKTKNRIVNIIIRTIYCFIITALPVTFIAMLLYAISKKEGVNFDYVFISVEFITMFLCFYYRPYFIECQSLFQTFCVKKCYIIDKQFVIWYSEIS